MKAQEPQYIQMRLTAFLIPITSPLTNTSLNQRNPYLKFADSGGLNEGIGASVRLNEGN